MEEVQEITGRPGRNRSKIQSNVELPKPSPPGVVLAVCDLFTILLIPLLSMIFTAASESLQKYLYFWVLVSAASVLLVSSYGGYKQAGLTRALKSTDLAVLCYLAVSVTMLVSAVLLGHEHAVSRYWTTMELVLTPIAMFGARSLPIIHALPARGKNSTAGTVIICGDHCPKDLRKALIDQSIHAPILGVLFLSNRQEDHRDTIWPVIPNVEALLETVQQKSAQDIVFIHRLGTEFFHADIQRDLLSNLLVYPARIWLAVNLETQFPSLLTNRSGRYKLVQIGTDKLINSLNPVKRTFDLILSIFALIILFPFFLVIAILVGASSGLPVVFKQDRIGAHGQRFKLLKFRTMSSPKGALFVQARPNDPRVTPVGRFLRRCSLDETLQMINVLKGEMSVVGPRPHAPETQVEGINFESAVKYYQLRYRVKPGITGLAQIRGLRGETPVIETLERRIESDLEYIENWSVWLDIKILWRTLPIVFTQKNAY
jgi:exopolysaccharide biosynthesis polyprenyl glycosylphosphotransferase